MPKSKTLLSENRPVVSVHWFRQDLRLHDNPALLAALKDCKELYPVFIFDGKVASTQNCGFHRMRFLYESLQDIDDQFKLAGGRLYTYQGETVDTLRQIIQEWGVTRLTFDDEPEAVWHDRDEAVHKLCESQGVECISVTAHTLWNPHETIKVNGGKPPLTYSIFNHVTESMGKPPRPVPDPTFKEGVLIVCDNFEEKFALPSYSKLGYEEESLLPDERFNKWKGGEHAAIQLLKSRLLIESEAFSSGYALPNQYLPDLVATPKSLSAHLKFGCVSVRKFYWQIQDLYKEVTGSDDVPPLSITAQLIWREYFYTMSAQNINYGQIRNNPICLPIPWSPNVDLKASFEKGQTGYPFIDAIMNQLRTEGWVHHVGRHTVASFLTRGDLWYSWEIGVEIFEKHLIDYDWSICAGNWMWVSSSAFEKALDCPRCFDPVKYGQRMDPTGIYVRRYVPILKHMPIKYLFQPWLAPRKIQQEAGCLVGVDYPTRITDHRAASRENSVKMDQLRQKLYDQVDSTIGPSNISELRLFAWLPDTMAVGTKCTGDSMCEGIAGL